MEALIEPKILAINGFFETYNPSDAYDINASPHPTGSIAFFSNASITKNDRKSLFENFLLSVKIPFAPSLKINVLQFALL